MELRASDNKRDVDLRHYDSLTLAMHAFDLLIERTGFDEDLDRDGLCAALVPLLTAMDEAEGKAPDAERHGRMVDRVLAGLRNDRDGRRPFEIEYSDYDDDGRAVRRKLLVRLVVDHFHPNGGTVLRLSPEAINLFVNALDLDVEDAQTAAEAIVESQLSRGQLDRAMRAATNARLHSLQLRDKIRALLRDTERNIDQVDWKTSVPKLVEEALGHITRRLDSERAILETTHQLESRIREGDHETAASLARIAQLMGECQRRHMELHRDLMRARNVFLDTQERQGFVLASAIARQPELVTDVLEPILSMSRKDAKRLLDLGVPKLVGARAAPLFSLRGLVRWQLRPRRPAPRATMELVPQDLSRDVHEDVVFTPDVRARAQELLDAIDHTRPLSALLEELRESGEPQEVREAFVFLVLQHYAPDEAKDGVRVTNIRGARILDSDFFGDDLMVGPAVEAAP